MNQEANNVLVFPTLRSHKENVSTQNVTNNLLQFKLSHINETISLVVPMIFNNLEVAGFYLNDEDKNQDSINIKDGTFIVESIKAILYKYYGLYHPFQDIAQNIFDNNEDLNIVDSIKLEFKTET